MAVGGFDQRAETEAMMAALGKKSDTVTISRSEYERLLLAEKKLKRIKAKEN